MAPRERGRLVVGDELHPAVVARARAATRPTPRRAGPRGARYRTPRDLDRRPRPAARSRAGRRSGTSLPSRSSMPSPTTASPASARPRSSVPLRLPEIAHDDVVAPARDGDVLPADGGRRHRRCAATRPIDDLARRARGVIAPSPRAIDAHHVARRRAAPRCPSPALAHRVVARRRAPARRPRAAARSPTSIASSSCASRRASGLAVARPAAPRAARRACSTSPARASVRASPSTSPARRVGLGRLLVLADGLELAPPPRAGPAAASGSSARPALVASTSSACLRAPACERRAALGRRRHRLHVMPQAGSGVGLAVAAEQHHAGGLVEPSGLREERRGLRELSPELRRARLREHACRSELPRPSPRTSSHARTLRLSPAAQSL